MTHLEKFIALYAEFGIECKVNKYDDRQTILMAEEGDAGYGEEQVTRSDKFGGYSYFHTLVTFNLEGNFLKQEFYE